MTAAKNLLRPNQVEESKRELVQMDSMLNSPPHQRNHITDIRGMKNRRDRLAKQLDEETPRPFVLEEKDAALKRFSDLSESIKEGMPSSEVMRRNPPGAVQRNLWWTKKNRETIPEYKNMALRLLAGGDTDPVLGDSVSNIEMLRPLKETTDPDMQGAQIPKERDVHLSKVNSTILSNEQTAALQEIDPELAGQLALLSAEHRAAIKEMLSRVLEASDEPEEVVVEEVTEKPEQFFASTVKMQELQHLAATNGIKAFGRKKHDLLEELVSKGLVQE